MFSQNHPDLLIKADKDNTSVWIHREENHEMGPLKTKPFIQLKKKSNYRHSKSQNH